MDKEADPKLEDLLDEERCYGAALALAKRRGLTLEDMRFALASGSVHVRRSVLWLIGERRMRDAVRVLIRVLEDRSEDVDVRRNAAQALGKIGDEAAIEPLARALGTQDLRSIASMALGQLNPEASLEAMIELLPHPDAGMRQGATWALGEIGSPKAINALEQALQDPDESVVEGASWALRRIKKAQD